MLRQTGWVLGTACLEQQGDQDVQMHQVEGHPKPGGRRMDPLLTMSSGGVLKECLKVAGSFDERI